MSFVMLTESQVVPQPSANGREGGISHSSTTSRQDGSDENKEAVQRMEQAVRLFEILSARSDIDHPVCTECTDLIVQGLQKRLGSTSRERDAYAQFLREVTNDVPTEEECQRAEKDLAELKKREETAFAELEDLEREKDRLEDEIASLDEEARQLNSEEEAFWRSRNAFTARLSAFQQDRDSLNQQYDHDCRQVERLQRTNVYNDAFNVGHDGLFGTINGLRLGRLQSSPVEWQEVNAAWGQTTLLLATVAEKLGFTFRGYRLNPMGSTTSIDKLDYSQQHITPSNDIEHPVKPQVTTLTLYYSGDILATIPFLHRRFDSAMVAFLECLRQLGDFVEHGPQSSTTAPPTTGTGAAPQGMKLPYAIRKDRIGPHEPKSPDASIKLGGFAHDEQWTRACKYTLTCCKFLLAHASNVSGPGATGGRKV